MGVDYTDGWGDDYPQGAISKRMQDFEYMEPVQRLDELDPVENKALYLHQLFKEVLGDIPPDWLASEVQTEGFTAMSVILNEYRASQFNGTPSVIPHYEVDYVPWSDSRAYETCRSCGSYVGDRCEVVADVFTGLGRCRLWHSAKMKLVAPLVSLSDGLPTPSTERADDSQRAKRIIAWGSLKLGLQYLPGDIRHGRKLTAAYGHVRGTFGQADDGMAIDVWVNLGGKSQKLWKLQQLTESGEHDEYKFILGVPSAKKARELYSQNMPPEFIGKVSPAKEIDISPIKVSKQRNKKSLQDIRPGSADRGDDYLCPLIVPFEQLPENIMLEMGRTLKLRQDDQTFPSDPVELEDELASEIARRIQPVISDRLTRLERAVSTAQKSYGLLDQKVAAIYDEFDRGKVEQVLFEVFTLSNLIGRAQVIDEIKEPGQREDAGKTPEYLRLPFEEAIAHLRRKVSIPTKSWRDFTAEQHEFAYTIAGLLDANLLEDMRWLINHSQQEGLGFETFQKMFRKLIQRRGWRPGPLPEQGKEDWRLRVAFETPLRRSISAGRNRQMKELVDNPETRKLVPGRMWIHTSTRERYRREYPNARLHHLALHYMVLASDDPFWEVAAPSCAYLCRCNSALVPRWKMERDGLVISKAPDPRTIAEPGFRRSAGLVPKDEQKQAAEAVLPRLSEDIRAKVKKDLEGKGII